MPVEGGAARDITTDNAADDNARVQPGRQAAGVQRQLIKDFYADRARLMLFERRGGNVAVSPKSGTAPRTAWCGRPIRTRCSAPSTTRDEAHVSLRHRRRRAARVTREHSFSSLAIAGTGPVIVGLRQSFTEPPTLVSIIARTGAATKLRISTTPRSPTHAGPSRERHL